MDPRQVKLLCLKYLSYLINLAIIAGVVGFLVWFANALMVTIKS